MQVSTLCTSKVHKKMEVGVKNEGHRFGFKMADSKHFWNMVKQFIRNKVKSRILSFLSEA